jgi:hypothetical protein
MSVSRRHPHRALERHGVEMGADPATECRRPPRRRGGHLRQQRLGRRIGREPLPDAHWNGTAWKQVPSPKPSPGASSVLYSVAATSASNAWAVGTTEFASAKTLILHWNGTAWKRVPSPSPAFNNILYGVAASSASNVWAVGYAENATLILHWNGTAWRRVPSPNPGSEGSSLFGVAATSARNAWAVGSHATILPTLGPTCEATLICRIQRARSPWRGLRRSRNAA